MGAWGSGHFDNDDAGDLIAELVGAEDWSVATEAFERVACIGDEEYLEAPQSSVAIAAAAIVAHKLGKIVASFDPADLPAIEALLSPEQELVTQARAALVRIKKQSELADLWDEAGAKGEWLTTVDQLEKAL